MKENSIMFKLVLEPVTIKTMLPERTLVVCGGMIILCMFSQCAVDAVLFVLLNLDI
jgi:hypothetical protein